MQTLHSAQQQHHDTCRLSKYKHKLICSLINLGISDLLFQAVFSCYLCDHENPFGSLRTCQAILEQIA